MTLSIDEVYRDYSTSGVPLSGDHRPVKSEIRRLLKQIVGGTAAVGDYRGAWSGGTAYVQSDYVQYGGSLWLSKRANTGVTPIEGADWTLLLPGVTVADGSVTTNKLAPGAVTLEKLSPGLAASVPLLTKADPWVPVILKTGAGSASVRAGTAVRVGTTVVLFGSDTAITTPAMTAGTDYAVFVSDAGAAQAVAWTANTGTGPTAPVGTWAWVGGFHYAPGANATAYNTGGNRTPQINPYSCWDLKFRPKCPDPRGMVLVAGKFWCDIYITGVDHHLNGTSRHGVTIATGDVLPKLPAMFGGNGSTLVTQLDWYWSNELVDSHGKRMLKQVEFRTAAFGVIEQAAGGRVNDPLQTGINFNNNGGGTNNDERYTSIWGLNLSIANFYVWGQETMGHTYEGTYVGTTQTAPQITPNYHQAYVGRARGYSPQLSAPFQRGVLLGGSTGSNVIGYSGSGSVDWANAVQSNSGRISVRAAADHLMDI